MRIRTKLLLSFLVGIIILLIVGTLAISSFVALEKETRVLQEENIPEVKFAVDMALGLEELDSAVKALLLESIKSTDSQESVLAARKENIKVAQSRFEGALAGEREAISIGLDTVETESKEEERELQEIIDLNEISEDWDVYKAKTSEIIGLLDQNAREQALELYEEEVLDLNNNLILEVLAVQSEAREELEEEALKISKKAEDASRSTLFVVIVGVVSAVLISVYFAYSFTKPIIKLTNEINSISKGDLSRVIKPTTKDEIGELSESLARIVASMKLAVLRTNQKNPQKNPVSPKIPVRKK